MIKNLQLQRNSFFEKDILQKNIAKIRWRVKGHLFYHRNYTLWEEPEYLRESELQHMKKNHVHSKKNYQRMKVIGHIHDT